MKKIFIVIICGFILILNGCVFISGSDLYQTVLGYQAKLNEIIEDSLSEDLSFNHQRGYKSNLSAGDYDPNKMVPREDFLAVYNNQKDNTFDVKLDEFLRLYKALLDEIIIKLDELGISGGSASIEYNYNDEITATMYVSVTSDKSLLIKMAGTFYSVDMHMNLKLGYESDDFYIRELGISNHPNFYEYFEFLENHQIINIRYYNNNNFWYRNTNQNDKTFYEISEQKDSFENHSTSIRWFNPETNIRTTISTGGIDSGKYFELFNDKTVIFDYSERLNSSEILLSWQLLEATGWDHAYLNDGFHTPYNGVYRDGELVFENALQYNTDLYYFANLRVMLAFDKEEITNEVLNLSLFGLDFNHPELTLDYIENVMEHALEESKHLGVYRGIDFSDPNLRDALYDEIDDDVKPN